MNNIGSFRCRTTEVLTLLLLSGACACLAQSPSSQEWPPKTTKTIESIQIQRSPKNRKPITTRLDELWRTYVVNATDASVMGMTLDGKQVWLSAAIGRTCSLHPPDPCTNDEKTWRMILIQGCTQPQESIALIYKDTDGQLYQTDPPLTLVPKCSTGGAVILFHDP